MVIYVNSLDQIYRYLISRCLSSRKMQVVISRLVFSRVTELVSNVKII